jgi:hypothetical protein
LAEDFLSALDQFRAKEVGVDVDDALDCNLLAFWLLRMLAAN